jgi:hypothetical protein
MLSDFREQLKICWTKSTAFSGGSTGSSKGQCYVTALLTYDVLGGKIMHGYVNHNGKRLHHFWNMLTIGGRSEEVDFTSDQYGGDGFTPLIKGEVYSKPNLTNKRFLKIKRNYLSLLLQNCP